MEPVFQDFLLMSKGITLFKHNRFIKFFDITQRDPSKDIFCGFK
jgi:hypothetical protein